MQYGVGKMDKKIIIFGMIIVLIPLVYGATPVLYFSDIVSGPKVGNTDGAGGLSSNQHGSIVTLWGNFLGSSQGSSKIYFKDSLNNDYETAHVYYWTIADGNSGGGPADLYTYHGMEEIAFSIPSGVADGLGKIYVKVNGMDSNELNFTIRNGNIYFVNASGNNTLGNGSWDNPWRTVSVLSSFGNQDYDGASDKVEAGDIIYVCDGVNEIDSYPSANGISGIRIRMKTGNESHPFSMIAYPGATAIANGTHIGITTQYSGYWVFSKYTVYAGEHRGTHEGCCVYSAMGIRSNEQARIIANEITNKSIFPTNYIIL